jgi:pilus assembly protein CpaB
MFLRIILLVVGAACVLLGVVVLASWYGQRTSQTPVVAHVESPADTRAPVLAAAHPILKGTLLRKEDIVSKDLKPDERLLPGSLAPGQEQDFVGALVRRDFAAAEPLIASEFVKPNDRSFLAAALRPGFRATSVFVDAAQSVAGLALPGDFVDVILVQSFDNATATDPGRRTSGETVLRGVRVLAVDQATSAPTGVATAVGSEPHIPKTVTLEVTEQQAKKLLVASKLGTFELSLLPLDAVAEANPLADWLTAGPVWASDVSPALGQMVKAPPKPGPKVASASCPPVTGSTLDKSVRCVPSRFVHMETPVATESPPQAAGQGQPAVRVAPGPAGEASPND